MYLMTHSLLSSWQYLYNAYDEDKAHEDFLKTLMREPIKTNEAMRNGLEFERLVQMNCEGQEISAEHKWFDCINEVADIVTGGAWQVKAHRQIIIDNIEFLLYGRFDVLKAGTIYDLKFSKTYEAGKYLDNTQHPVYLELEKGAIDFKYIISNGNEVFTETYTRRGLQPLERIISGFMRFLQISDLEKVYFEKWKTFY